MHVDAEDRRRAAASTSGRWPTSRRVTATGPEGTAHTWTAADATSTPTARGVHGEAAGTCRARRTSARRRSRPRGDLSLLEVRGATFRADQFDARHDRERPARDRAASPAGDYDLLPEGATARRSASASPTAPCRQGYVLGRCPAPGDSAPASRVQHRSRRRRRDGKVTRPACATPRKFTRVHVFATRYVPAFGAFGNLGTRPRRASRTSASCPARRVGVPDRPQHRRRVPLRPRPAASRRSTPATCWSGRGCCSTRGPSARTETGEQQARRAAMFAAAAPPDARACRGRQATPAGRRPRRWQTDFANLDFLADASAVAGEPRRRTRTASIEFDAQGRSGRTRPARRRGRPAEHDQPLAVACPSSRPQSARPAAREGARPDAALHAAEAGDACSARASRSRSPTSRARGSRCTTAWPRCTRLYADAHPGPEAGRVPLRPDLAEAEAGGEAGAVLEVRLPRAELLPREEGPGVLQRRS